MAVPKEESPFIYGMHERGGEHAGGGEWESNSAKYQGRRRAEHSRLLEASVDSTERHFRRQHRQGIEHQAQDDDRGWEAVRPFGQTVASDQIRPRERHHIRRQNDRRSQHDAQKRPSAKVDPSQGKTEWCA